MIEQDTIRLLRECDAGLRMGIDSIDEVVEHIQDSSLKQRLNACKKEHRQQEDEIQTLLEEYNDSGKEPNAMAKSMSWIKTNVKIGLNSSDATVADLITDGCNMGVKSLARYLNQYKAADERSKDITRRLISTEESLAKDIRQYL